MTKPVLFMLLGAATVLMWWATVATDVIAFGILACVGTVLSIALVAIESENLARKR